MSTLAIIFWIVIALIAYAFREALLIIAAFVGICAGIGALISWIVFDNASVGAYVGIIIAVLFGLRIIIESYWYKYENVIDYAYHIVSSPFWLLNRIQLILTGPWRYYFKYVSISDSSRDILRPFFYFLQIILYIITTPLRLLNSIIYNIFIYGLTELYDLVCEVIFPNNYNEGKGDFWGWILWFPVRLVRYPIFHGFLVFIEGSVWTVIDIFIPAVTMYHGTNLAAAKAIVGSSTRNRDLWSNWLAGTFKASDSANGWGGLGVYFSPARKIAVGYSDRAGGNPVFIVCRVSMGKILNYALAPTYVEANVGGGRQHSQLNRYADKNGYITAEWWNGSYWEYCMFDWQNRYNYPWRIRPIYVYNVRTCLAQHIDGGFRHWLFSKAVFDDIIKSTRFTCLVVMAIIIVVWFYFNLITSNYRWHTPDFFVSDPPKVEEYVADEVEKTETIESVIVEPVVPEPVVPKAPKSTYVPKTTPASSSRPYTPSKSSTRRSSSRKQKGSYSTTNSQPKKKSKYGFTLEKVDRIPTRDNLSDKNTNTDYTRY